jgi:RimJ/RimL family protein N-acetyltransferase
LVALDGDEIVGVARYDARAGSTEAEIALTIEDAWQHRGLGSQLARRLGKVAQARGYERFVATMLPDNRAALALIHKMSPDATVRFVAGEYEASVPLGRAS